MMMVTGTALAVEEFAIVIAQRIDFGGVGEGLQAAIDRGQSD